MTKTYGKQIVFGIPEKQKTIIGLPQGRSRLRLRPDDWAKVAVKTQQGARFFYLEDKGENWEASFEIGSNQTIK